MTHQSPRDGSKGWNIYLNFRSPGFDSWHQLIPWEHQEWPLNIIRYGPQRQENKRWLTFLMTAGCWGWGGDWFGLVIVVKALATAVVSSDWPSTCLGLTGCSRCPCSGTWKSTMQKQENNGFSLQGIAAVSEEGTAIMQEVQETNQDSKSEKVCWRISRNHEKHLA